MSGSRENQNYVPEIIQNVFCWFRSQLALLVPRITLRELRLYESCSQRPEDNLYEYCALAQEIYGFGMIL